MSLPHDVSLGQLSAGPARAILDPGREEESP